MGRATQSSNIISADWPKKKGALILHPEAQTSFLQLVSQKREPQNNFSFPGFLKL